MLNLRLLKNRIFRNTISVSLFTSSAYSGYLFVMPQFLQLARGASALSSGLTTFPGAIGLWVNSQLSARAYPIVGPKRLMLLGLTGVTTVFCCFSLIELSTSTWLIRALTFMQRLVHRLVQHPDPGGRLLDDLVGRPRKGFPAVQHPAANVGRPRGRGARHGHLVVGQSWANDNHGRTGDRLSPRLPRCGSPHRYRCPVRRQDPLMDVCEHARACREPANRSARGRRGRLRERRRSGPATPLVQCRPGPRRRT